VPKRLGDVGSRLRGNDGPYVALDTPNANAPAGARRWRTLTTRPPDPRRSWTMCRAAARVHGPS